jgi:hypothetical protein
MLEISRLAEPVSISGRPLLHGVSSSQAVWCWPLTTEFQAQLQVSECGICGGQCGTGTCFFQSSSVLHCTIIRPWLHTHISLASHECYVILVTDIIKYNMSPCSPHRGQIVYTLIAFLAV